MVATSSTLFDAALIPRACIAVDWCGAIADAPRRMWLAEARASGSGNERTGGPGTWNGTALGSLAGNAPGARRASVLGKSNRGSLVRLECGRDRVEIVEHLIACARREPRIVVGLDFAFSFPSWFLRARDVASARDGWELAAREGERWLAHCPRPFWGKPGARRPKFPPDRSEWRATEGEAVRVRGIGPKSVFQVGGAGSVGTGSVRGMPHLVALQDAGFSIWPFDPPRLPMVVEIYPRYLTGAVNKSSPVARALYVQSHLPHERREIQDLASSTEDAFDAAVSVSHMIRHRREFARAPRDAHDGSDVDLEGRIWMPLRDPMFPLERESVRRRERARAAVATE